jgi:membrane-associated protease RseP (regulator of RpoE activity)
MKKELENLTESDEKVRQLLASLKQVEAPKDFEFRLKARIAGASPKAYKTSYKRRFAFALPAFASIAVSAFVVINGNFFGGANQVSSIPETPAQSSFVQMQNQPGEAVAVNTFVNNKQPEEIFSADSNAQNRKDEKPRQTLTAFNFPEKPKNEIRKPASKENFGGSKDVASTSAESQLPRGLKPNLKIEPSKDFNNEKDFSVQEILSPLGVEVVPENGKWKVKNVTRNSAAERSGIKTDDIIETLDGRKLSDKPLRGKKIEVKKLGVKRGGAPIELNLQSNPK